MMGSVGERWGDGRTTKEGKVGGARLLWFVYTMGKGLGVEI